MEAFPAVTIKQEEDTDSYDCTACQEEGVVVKTEDDSDTLAEDESFDPQACVTKIENSTDSEQGDVDIDEDVDDKLVTNEKVKKEKLSKKDSPDPRSRVYLGPTKLRPKGNVGSELEVDEAKTGDTGKVLTYKGCMHTGTKSGHLNKYLCMHTAGGPNLDKKGFPCSAHLDMQKSDSKTHSTNVWNKGHLGLNNDQHIITIETEQVVDNVPRVPEPGKVFTCEECGHTCSQSGHLNEHLRIHTGEKPYPCGECCLKFARGDTLKSHRKTHSGDKPYKCSQCGAAFPRKESLNRHVRYHTGVRPYQCKVCGVQYVESVSLRRHVRVHTGERPFACPYCPKAFAVKYSLGRHVASHTGEKKHSCGICGKPFARRYALTNHILKAHAQQSSASIDPDKKECSSTGLMADDPDIDFKCGIDLTLTNFDNKEGLENDSPISMAHAQNKGSTMFAEKVECGRIGFMSDETYVDEEYDKDVIFINNESAQELSNTSYTSQVHAQLSSTIDPESVNCGSTEQKHLNAAFDAESCMPWPISALDKDRLCPRINSVDDIPGGRSPSNDESYMHEL